MRTSKGTGLTDQEVVESRKQYGTNALVERKKESFFHQFLASLGDPIIRILLIALGIKTVFLIQNFDWFETIGIVIAIFLASFISTLSEYGSEKAFLKLQEESSKITCLVKRNGKVIEIGIEEVVVGDLVLLGTGDRVPADGILVEGHLSVDESSLNGESKEAYKEAGTEKDKLFRGSVIYSDNGLMQVVKVGSDTFYGRIYHDLQEKQPESPLKLRLRHLAKIISRIGYIGAILVSLSYLFHVIVLDNQFDHVKMWETITNFPVISGHILYALTLSVTIIVVAVPEGLPMMITLVLSSNMKRMLKNNVLVRKLVGIETAGSVNILFTDKTGTLTKGQLEVTTLIDGENTRYENFQELPQKYEKIVTCSMVGNNSSYYDSEKKAVVGGNSTDRALLSYVSTKNLEELEVLKSLPFDSRNKYSVSLIRYRKQTLRLIKGAPEKLLARCSSYIDKEGKKRLFLSKKKMEENLTQATKEGVRVLLLAISDRTTVLTDFSDLTFVGFVYIKDEIRKSSIEGVKLVKDAHIQTVMITGDNKNTAKSIAEEVGLITNSSDVVLTTDELNALSDEELKGILPDLRVVARALPQDKSRLVRVSQESGLVVGMTGDGVNDAPALKKADVGFAMGSGTEVAKEASEIVILDDNFLSISKAILFGRTIFKSIRKFIIFQLTVNLCAILLSIVGPFIGVDTPVTVIQMLWINMVMDTLAGIAFAYEPPVKGYMKEYPKKREEPILNRYMMGEILFTGLYSAILCILFLKLPFFHQFFRVSSNDQYFLTAFFGLFIFVGIFNSFNARTVRLNLFCHLFRNPVFMIIMLFVIIVQVLLIYFGGDLFRTAGLTIKELFTTLCFAATVIPVDFLRKLFLRFQGKTGGV